MSCGGGTDNSSDDDTSSESEPIRFFCAMDDSCPEILIASDPHATSGTVPSAFRGYGDPSLAFDESTNTVWMAYSWLDILNNPEFPQNINLGMRTHLARSSNGGDTFEYVSGINSTESILHPDTNVAGWLIHETPTLIQQADTNWQVLWFQYYSPVPGNPGVQTERSDFLFKQSVATTPELLGQTAVTHASSNLTSAGFGTFFNLNTMQDSTDNRPLSGCTAFTEPELFVFQNETYLIGQCLVFTDGSRDPSAEKLFLLKQDDTEYIYVAALTNYNDAQQFGADVLTQPDVSFARDGAVILTMTPKVLGSDPEHQGCVVVTFDDFAEGALIRTSSGSLVERAIITAEGNGLGPGLCTYDPNSSTGILIVVTIFGEAETVFSLRRTGIHP